ncbi:hypothetical protein SDC9_166950 [bioreactor metagenome]|uniref:Uncharacterized protein n=1 Tax=bioreactor metagenome TaxID=1076179 RepID=A0A645G197_9ZZZZ
MVRRAKRSFPHQSHALWQRTGDRVQLGDRHLLVIGHIGQNGGEPPCQHAFARAGRPDKQKVVQPCRRHGERALGLILSAHFGIIGDRPNR